MEHLKQGYKTGDKSAAYFHAFGNPCAESGLRDIEHKEHNGGKNRDTEPFIRENGINFIADILILGKNLTGFNLPYYRVDKLKTLTVCRFNLCLVGQVNILLHIRYALLFVHLCCCGVNQRLQAVCRSGNGFHNGTAEFRRKSVGINFVALLFTDVTLIKSNNNGNAKFQKLCGKEKAAAQIVRIHDIDNDIGIFILYIRACNAFFTCKG